MGWRPERSPGLRWSARLRWFKAICRRKPWAILWARQFGSLRRRKKTLVEKFMKMSPERIDGKIKKSEKDIKKLEENFETLLKGLQAKYEKAEKDKEASLKEIKESGLGIMKAVKAHKEQSGKSEL